MASTDRVVRVSAGAEEYVTGRVTERTGKDLSLADFEVGLGGWDAPPPEWRGADEVAIEGGGSVALVSMLVGPSTPPVERAHLWVRVHDAPEVLPRRCDGGTVTVE